MEVYAYYRVSTDTGQQDDTRQRSAIDNYCESKNIQITHEVTEQVSGKISYKHRALFTLLEQMKEGDMLICADLTRISRSGRDFSNLIHEWIIPRKMKLFVVSMGIEVDGGNMTTAMEMLLSNIAFGAQMELEFKRNQCSEGMKVRLNQLKKQGYFISRVSGKRREHWGNPKGTDMSVATAANSLKRAQDRINWFTTSRAVEYIRRYRFVFNVHELVDNLNEELDRGRTEYLPRESKRWNKGKVYSILRVVKHVDAEFRMDSGLRMDEKVNMDDWTPELIARVLSQVQG